MKVIAYKCLLLVTLASAAMSAQAQLYKCQQSDGTYAFQDSPCTAGSKGGEMEVHSSTGDSLGVAGTASRGAMTALKAAIKSIQKRANISPAGLACVNNLSNSGLTSAYASLLSTQLTADEHHEVDKFYSSSAGEKLMRQGAHNVALMLGDNTPYEQPTFIDAERRQIDAFKQTSAGHKMMTVDMWTSPEAKRLLSGKINEMLSGCGVHI